jgi:hypothetical protein
VRSLLLVVGLSSLIGSSATAQAVIIGRVRDIATRQPIAGARILVSGTRSEITSEDDGAFVVDVGAAGLVTLHLMRLGYDSISVSVEAPTPSGQRFVFEMRRAAATLDTVVVSESQTVWSAKLEGFEHRRVRGGGSYVLRSEIERRRPLHTTDLLRRISGVRVVDSMGVRLVASARGGKLVHSGSRIQNVPCVMRVGVDGQIKEWGFSPDQIATEEIHGIEIYAGPATIPREFATQTADGFCGLVMIWTR